MSNMPDAVELPLSSLKKDELTQLTHLLKLADSTWLIGEAESTGGVVRIPGSIVLQMHDFMMSQPSLLQPWWENILSPKDWKKLISLESFLPDTARTSVGAYAEPGTYIAPKEEKKSTEKATPEALMQIFLAARHVGTESVLLKTSNQVHLSFDDRGAFLGIGYLLSDATWRVDMRAKESAVHPPLPGAAAFAAVLTRAWDFYQALDPDGFPEGLEGLFQELMRAVSKHYGLK